jgi:hypothetical protein
MIATLPLAELIGLAVLCCLIGFLFGVIAIWRPAPAPADPGPGQTRAAPPLPRAGYLEPFPTAPISLESEHHAQLDRTEAEIRAMIAAAERHLP